MNKMNSLLKRMFLCCAAALMLGVSADMYANEQALTLPDDDQKDALGILESTLKVRDDISWTVTSKDGKAQGILLSSELAGKDVEGYMGKTPVFILINPQNQIQAMVTGKNDETPEYLEAAEDGIFENWYDLEVKGAEDLEVDAVSGATYSSNALIENIKRVLRAFNKAGK